MNQTCPQSSAAAFLHAAQDAERRESQVHGLRDAPSAEDDDGQPLSDGPASGKAHRRAGAAAGGKQRSPHCSKPPRASKERPFAPRPTHQEVEHRVAEAQLWIAQRLPLVEIRANARQNWGITNVRTVSRYLALARERMVEELIQNRLQHQAEQMYGLNELIRQAMAAGQFNAAVGAYRVIGRDRWVVAGTAGGAGESPVKRPVQYATVPLSQLMAVACAAVHRLHNHPRRQHPLRQGDPT